MPEIDFKRLSFREAIDFLRQKQNIPTERWDDLWQEEHDFAFTVAGATNAELLNDLYQAVEEAISQGLTRREFAQQFDEIVARNGWQFRGARDWRIDTIYRTNLRSAYAAGRYQQMTEPSTLKARPYWQWIHGDSRKPRPLHKALHRKVFRADDPFWKTMYPPCGFGCRCSVVTLSQRDIDRENLEVETAPKVGQLWEIEDGTGKKAVVPVEADPGWAYAPGASREEERQAILSNSLSRISPSLQTALNMNAPERQRITDKSTLVALKNLLETNYQDGITNIPMAVLEGETFKGIFEDSINKYSVKRYQFKITPKRMAYRLANPEVTENDFSEGDLVEFATKGKKCTKGTKCGGSCISAKKTCTKSMSSAQKKAHKALLRKVGTVETSLAKKRREAKEARGGGLAPSTIKRKERLQQAKAAKEKFDTAQAKAALAEKNYGKQLNTQDAKTLGISGRVTFGDLKRIREERDAAKAELDKFGSAIKREEKFKAGRPLSDKQINKPLSQQELDKLGDFGKLPNPQAYGRGTEMHSKAVELQRAYQEGQKAAPGLTPQEFKTIRSYTKGSHYQDKDGNVHGYILSNAAARGLMKNPNSDTAKAGVTQARLVHSALGKLPDWKGEVRRDTQLPKSQFTKEYQVGKKVKLNGVTSTTSDLSGKSTKAYGNQGDQKGKLAKESSKAGKYNEVAESLGIKTIPSGDSVQVEYQMNVKTGKNISQLSAAKSESEISLRHGWTGTVRKVEEIGENRFRVYLDED